MRRAIEAEGIRLLFDDTGGPAGIARQDVKKADAADSGRNAMERNRHGRLPSYRSRVRRQGRPAPCLSWLSLRGRDGHRRRDPNQRFRTRTGPPTGCPLALFTQAVGPRRSPHHLSVPLPRLSSIRAVRAEIKGRSTDVFRRDREFDVSAPPRETQHLLPKSVFDRPGSDRWNLASTTFRDAGPMVRIRFPPAASHISRSSFTSSRSRCSGKARRRGRR
jgi:hypothetical protein